MVGMLGMQEQVRSGPPWMVGMLGMQEQFAADRHGWWECWPASVPYNAGISYIRVGRNRRSGFQRVETI